MREIDHRGWRHAPARLARSGTSLRVECDRVRPVPTPSAPKWSSRCEHTRWDPFCWQEPPLLPGRKVCAFLLGTVHVEGATPELGHEARATNPPRELPHIFLTALARSVRWTGVYEPRLDAIARDGTSTIHRLHGLLRGDLAVRAADDARYAQISSPV